MASLEYIWIRLYIGTSISAQFYNRNITYVETCISTCVSRHEISYMKCHVYMKVFRYTHVCCRARTSGERTFSYVF